MLIAQPGLEPGELIKDGYFSLFEAVGAPEVRRLPASRAY